MTQWIRSSTWIERLLPGCALALTLCLHGTNPAAAAGLLIADGGFGGALEIVEQTVDVTINNGIAVTHIDQVFRNTEDRQVEALYTFPVPKGASVANFSMWIEGKEMIGEVLEKERAREIYESYKQVRRDPGLLEQRDFKTFEMRIFPIGPRAEQRVQVSYYQELDFDNDWATYVYPLATVAHEGRGSRTQGRFALTLEAASEVPITTIESPSHGSDFAVAMDSPHNVRASLETTAGDLNRDVVVAFQTSRPRTGLDLIASKEPGEDGYFLLTLTTGDELKGRQAGMDYVFVLDISGSMNDAGKLDLSQGSVAAFVDELGDEDRFEVIVFNVAAEELFGRLEPSTAGNREQAAAFLDRQQARGGTFLEPAIRAAYGYKDLDRPLNVVILSDGMTEVRERAALLSLIAQRPSATRVFSIGVGNEVNRPLLEQLAEDTGGLAAFISRSDNLERQARAFRRKLLKPAATDVEIDFQGGGVYDLEPARLPSLYHGSPLRLYGRYRQSGPVALHLQADVGGHRLDKTLEIELPESGADGSEIERMWAWHRIQQLLKEADRKGSRTGVVDEVVRLGETYSIASEYTSFLVLENDAELRRWRIERRNQRRLERDRSHQAESRRELEVLRRKAAPGLGPVEKQDKMAAAKPVSPTLGRRSPSQQVQAQRRPTRGWDVDTGGAGGGAVDPLSAVLAVLAGLGLATRRRRGK